MSLLGTLIVLLIVSVVIILVISGVIFDRLDRHKREDLRHKRETAQRRSATVVSIENPFVWTGRYSTKDDLHNYYLKVEWTNPETQRPVTSPTWLMPGHCPYHPGDRVFIYVHPAMRKVWLDESNQRLSDSSAHGGFFQ